MTQDAETLMAALDVLEQDEARHLAWGLTDESWTHEQVRELLREYLPDADADACWLGLLEADLLVEVPRTYPARYRSRMGEAVRLFTRLRQLFPGKPWPAGPRLVSDFRFLRRARSFPRRHIPAARVLASLREQGISESIIQEAGRILGERSISRFQEEATGAVLSALTDGRDSGIVVGAGTGSGKTLAFYLPTMAAMAASPDTRAIAIYPRNELLKDQFATAVREARRLRERGGRQLVIGAYFGPTPYKVGVTPDARSGWRPARGRAGHICPFLTCPTDTANGVCGHELVWQQPQPGGSPRDWGALVCGECGGRVTADEVALTRAAQQERPPDILFTTTEMLNQELSNGWTRHVFGVGTRSDRAPTIVLLDEIHTYTGTSGAQVAYLLRRWRRLVRQPMTWVGLSATLANAASFFADLCGVPVTQVRDIQSEPDEMVQRGSEYQLFLRGDPASQSALLSTSIQSLMLLRRILNDTGSADTTYGTKVFAFLENLDLVNRLYRQLLDAEGRDPFGRPRPTGTVLAGLRIPSYADGRIDIPDVAAWEQDGQYWWLADQLGFGSRSLAISRTSSQDTGVESLSDIVVATSALEVGYDDTRVGAVLQHKAPRDIAQFLQRRGRAGRLQSQRPWTVVVLSDFGRDRMAFQDYERLMDPTIPAKTLPLGNQSVRKMQATMCLIDWMAEVLGVDDGYRWSVREKLRAPTPASDQQAQACAQLLAEILEGGPRRSQLISFIRHSLKLTEEEVDSICWEHPRSLLLEVVPTAHRRLISHWGVTKDGVFSEHGDTSRSYPLPEFLPANLFSDLELPEVDIDPPADYDRAADTSLAIGMALAELAPGRVTLRWAVDKVKGLWIEAPASGVIDLDDRLAPGGEIVTSVPAEDGSMVPLVRPRTIRPEKPGPGVRSTSNGRLRWMFRIDDSAAGMEIPPPRASPLGDLIMQTSVHLNTGTGPLTSWRYALEGIADLALQSGRERRAVRFVQAGSPAAVGFESINDALLLHVHTPTFDTLDFTTDRERLHQLRSDRFLWLCRSRLEEANVGPFLATWVGEVALAAIAHAILQGRSVDDLSDASPTQWSTLAQAVVDSVLLSLPRTQQDDVPLRPAVLDVFGDPRAVTAICAVVATLNENPNGSWWPWLRARFLQTLGAAVQVASQQLCEDFNADHDVIVDVLDNEHGPRIVISDTVPGGGGFVETLTRQIGEDPRRFHELIASALEASDIEQVDAGLRESLGLLEDNADVQTAARHFRSSRTDRLEVWKSLVDVLRHAGVNLSHALMTSLSSRVFRPGSGPASDDLVRLLLRRWDELNHDVGFAVDHRSACALLAEDEEVLTMLGNATPGGLRRDSPEAVSLVQSLLWVRATARRSYSLRTSNRFALDPPLTERTLVRDCLPQELNDIDVDGQEKEWREALTSELRARGQARLLSASGDNARLANAVRGLSVAPLDVDWLLVYPRVTKVVREGRQNAVTLSLREAAQ